ncbi:MAG: phosphate/phosphite/phosphonate ABC transporter substrate-binding protein [Phycisphaerae bacterium]
MKSRLLFFLLALVAIVAILSWLAISPTEVAPPASEPAPVPPLRFRLGLIPDHNLYEQRRGYRLLADYLDTHVHLNKNISTFTQGPPLRVELVTSSNYAGILNDFEDNEVDGAFLGSLVAVLAMDRCGAQVMIKTHNSTGQDTYAGTLFVPADSPLELPADLRGKKLAAVRTTMAGSIFPQFCFQQLQINDHDRPRILWSGTHDDVIEEVLARRADAGAVKDLRLDAWEREHPGNHFRRIATGPRAPENALVLSRSLSPEIAAGIVAALLHMQDDPDAAPVLQSLQVRRFETCHPSEYAALYNMIDALRHHWDETGIDGPPPASHAPAETSPRDGGN